MDSPREPYAWLEARAVRNASDAVLGCVLLVAAATAFIGSRAIPFDPSPGHVGDRFFPTVVAVLLGAVGAALLARGAIGRAPPYRRWRLWQILILAAFVAAIALARLASVIWPIMYGPAQWGPVASVFRLLGPADYASGALLVLVVAITLARLSHLRSAGMALLGLLLAVVGSSMESGQLRLTLGVDQLADGLDLLVVAPGIIFVAEGMVCLFSPALALAMHARRIVGWRDRALPTVAAIALRIVAGLVVAATCYLVFTASESVWDLGLVLLSGGFGLACKLLGWNRLVLLVGFGCSVPLELYFRQAMVISRGHFTYTYFLERPITAALLSAAVAILVAALTLSLYRALRRNAAGPAALA